MSQTVRVRGLRVQAGHMWLDKQSHDGNTLGTRSCDREIELNTILIQS